MNIWTEKSIKLAFAKGYLDKLSEIYPINLELERNITKKEKQLIKEALAKKDSKKLILTLLDFERFPIDDPYIGFLRKNKEAINQNPKTVKRIGKRLFEMGFENLIMGVSRAKTPSRQIGQLFKKYLNDLGYPVLNEGKFLKNNTIAILNGGDKTLMEFAKKELGYKRKKGLDLVMKINNLFVIGEAKLISSKGGTQDKSFREAISFIKHKNKKAIHIALLDGVIWLVNKNKKSRQSLYETVFKLNNNQIAISAVLLGDFIRYLNNNR